MLRPKRLSNGVLYRAGQGREYPPARRTMCRLRHAPDHGLLRFDHRPPLALRAEDADPNDEERLAAICWTCDQQKTPRDLKGIARASKSPASTRPSSSGSASLRPANGGR